jgi:hypothetical protein
MKAQKTCKLCPETFHARTTGRIKILRKMLKGESVAYVCPTCADLISMEKIAEIVPKPL